MLQGHVEGSRLLLEAGARALGPDHEGFTPLHRCCQEDPMAKEAEAGAEDAAEARAKFDRAKAAVARLLLERGADVNVREAKGHQVSCDWLELRSRDPVLTSDWSPEPAAPRRHERAGGRHGDSAAEQSRHRGRQQGEASLIPQLAGHRSV